MVNRVGPDGGFFEVYDWDGNMWSWIAESNYRACWNEWTLWIEETGKGLRNRIWGPYTFWVYGQCD